MKYCLRPTSFPFPYFALCTSEAEFKREIKKRGVSMPMPFLGSKQAHATTHSFENSIGQTICIVCLGSTKGRTRIEIYGLLIHEAVHIWQDAKLLMGEHSPSSEFEAYTVQFIAQQLMRAYEDGR